MSPRAYRKGLKIAGAMLACGVAFIFLVSWANQGKSTSTLSWQYVHTMSIW